ncbi:MAG: conserved hypothetical protein, DprA/Smf-related, family 1 [halophilic archaeon J07HX64]|nr:MAG: conserved hypothetical protein, DprA/Smf-related, family 1 [halophilic archaeon J07HX64]
MSLGRRCCQRRKPRHPRPEHPGWLAESIDLLGDDISDDDLDATTSADRSLPVTYGGLSRISPDGDTAESQPGGSPASVITPAGVGYTHVSQQQVPVREAGGVSMRVSVVGGSTIEGETREQARQVGRELAERGHELVCGGLGGVMEAACHGASRAGGHTIGVLPGEDPTAANPHVETAIATGLGNARNAVVVMNGEAAIAVDGSTGTLSEIALARDYGRPVAGLDTHRVDGVAVEHVETPAAAVGYVETAVGTDG